MDDIYINAFWGWFAAHQAEYRRLPENREHLLEAFEEKLHSIAKGLTFEMSHEKDGLCDLIIGVSGKEELVPVAKSVIAQAPKIPGWTMQALRPAQGFAFIHDFEGCRFDPRGMWFDPLTSKAAPSSLGIRVYVPEFDTAGKDHTRIAIWNILDTALGEESCLRDIKYVEVCALPEDPKGAGFLQLTDLPRYIEWYRHRK